MLNQCIRNKYYKIYFELADKIKGENRIYDSTIYENHHIIPVSLGGSDNNANLICLTFREHFLFHRLLVKFLTGKSKAKMIWSLHTFFHFDYRSRRNINTNSRLYEHHKKLFVQSMKYRTPWTKKETYTFKHRKTNEIFYGTISEFRMHSGLSSQEIHHLTNQTENKLMRYIKDWGIFLERTQCFSFELKRKSQIQKKKTCKHCSKVVTSANYTRWHGDACVNVNPNLRYNRTDQIRNLNKNN